MLEGVVPWPVGAAELYRKLGYWRGDPIGECFDRSIADNAARIAVVDGERRVTYRELGVMVERRRAIPGEGLTGIDGAAA